MSNKSKSVGIRMDWELYTQLTELAEQKNLTLSALVLEILRTGLPAAQKSDRLSILENRVSDLEQALESVRQQLPPAPKFKIGDRVRIVKAPRGKSSRIVGQKGTITYFDGHLYSVALENSSNCAATVDCLNIIEP